MSDREAAIARSAQRIRVFLNARPCPLAAHEVYADLELLAAEALAPRDLEEATARMLAAEEETEGCYQAARAWPEWALALVPSLGIRDHTSLRKAIETELRELREFRNTSPQ